MSLGCLSDVSRVQLGRLLHTVHCRCSRAARLASLITLALRLAASNVAASAKLSAAACFSRQGTPVNSHSCIAHTAPGHTAHHLLSCAVPTRDRIDLGHFSSRSAALAVARLTRPVVLVAFSTSSAAAEHPSADGATATAAHGTMATTDATATATAAALGAPGWKQLPESSPPSRNLRARLHSEASKACGLASRFLHNA